MDPLILSLGFSNALHGIRMVASKTAFLTILFRKNWIVSHLCPAVEFLLMYFKQTGYMYWVDVLVSTGRQATEPQSLCNCAARKLMDRNSLVAPQPGRSGCHWICSSDSSFATVPTLPLKPWLHKTCKQKRNSKMVVNVNNEKQMQPLCSHKIKLPITD